MEFKCLTDDRAPTNILPTNFNYDSILNYRIL